MPWKSILFRPGVNVEYTQYLNDGGWSICNLIRFRDGLPEKNGGWARLSNTSMVGAMRGALAWADLSGLPYFAAGGDQRLQVFSFGDVTDITPLIANTTPAVNFSTVINTPTVTVVDAGRPAGMLVGDWVNINVPVSIGGIVVHGYVQATVLPTATSFSFDWTSNATATVNNAGAVPVYTTVNLANTVNVLLNDHGLVTGDPYINQILTIGGGVTFSAYEAYNVSNVVDANNFEIQETAATGNATFPENAGNANLLYLVATGSGTATLLAGFGVGLFGSGYYGTTANTATYTTIRQYFLDQWGQDLIGNYPKSPILVWQPPVAGGNVALFINNTNFPTATSPPQQVNFSFVSMPSQILIALGCEPSGGGTQDPNLVRWCNVADFTDWVASAINQAGSFRIPSGSRLVGGIQGPTFSVIWTDIDMWIFNYIGFPLVFGFNKVAKGVGLLAARCMAVVQSTIYFASSNSIYKFDGSGVQIVQCPVWDILWQNLNRTQVDKCHMAVNSWFNELMLFFASSTGTGEVDSYIRYNFRENVWDYGNLIRLCWVDENVFGPPIGVDVTTAASGSQSGLIQQHEIATDADGAMMGEYIESGYFSLDNGYLFTAIQQVVANFKLIGTNAQLQFYVITLNYPKDTPVIYGPFTETLTAPQFETINSNGRVAAIRIGGSSVGSFWRLGNFRYLFSPNGTN